MRRSVAFFLLFVAGCGTSSNPDTDAARENVRRFYSYPAIALDITSIEEPEYATIPKIPGITSRSRLRTGQRPVASGLSSPGGTGTAPRTTTGWSG